MSVDTATVARIAHLARIRLEPHEAEPLAGELNRILGWIEQLGEVDTAGVEPMTAVIPNTRAWRADVIEGPESPTGGGRRDAVLANAPDAQFGFFAVPKVIE